MIGAVLEVFDPELSADAEDARRVGEGSLWCGSNPPDRSGSSNGQPVGRDSPSDTCVCSAWVCSPCCLVRVLSECGVGKTSGLGSPLEEGVLEVVTSSSAVLDLWVGCTILSGKPADVGRPACWRDGDSSAVVLDDNCSDCRMVGCRMLVGRPKLVGKKPNQPLSEEDVDEMEELELEGAVGM